MPKGAKHGGKQAEKIRVGVTSEVKDGSRIYTATVSCADKEFFLSDRFVERELVRSLNETLAESVQKAVQDYLGAADNYLRSVRPQAQANGNGAHAKAEAVGR